MGNAAGDRRAGDDGRTQIRCRSPIRAREARIAATRARDPTSNRSTGSSRTAAAASSTSQRKAPPKLAAALEKRNLVGFSFYPDEQRVYPQGSVASHVLGYAGIDNPGLAGLELQLDKTLDGTPGERDRRERRARPARDHDPAASPARDGRDVFLTIDQPHPGERRAGARSRRVAQWHAKDATAIVLDPHTGAVLAMAQAAGLRRERLPAATAHDLSATTRVTDVFEPGSVFKVVTIAGALSDHVVTPNTTFRSRTRSRSPTA